MPGRFVRLAETERRPVGVVIDGRRAEALEGDTVLTALLTNGLTLRRSEFGDGKRAGFCLMGACQDCWVWTRDGARLRACTTKVTAGLDIMTEEPGASWPSLA